ncbi:hypothetical protein BC332_30458 [Capsicum chinense]|uniref:Stress-response A/B barrel domain-containing protein n=1 Tax=Capsicum annuum TaxID=4072 RepID=A0A2G2Y9H0_CAPAN|nr:uncharacterized protein LOC107851389 [Capsicum annuum]KAF3647116.1 putative thaumatin-like protein-like [Capsicum annuum]PHT66201.1 hypothetical protein T459_30626 [Capsicum annuum]PHU00671.1 hypothetical protein BC332_30458 [Capsicum chinense]
MQILHTQSLLSSLKPFNLIPFSIHKFPKFDVADLGSHVMKANHGLKTDNRSVICSATEQPSFGNDAKRKRKVVEHVCLLKGKNDLSEEQEKDMLDYLYTTQYQMRGVVSISLGRVSGGNDDKYSHAIYMRFQRKENLLKFYQNQFYVDVLKDHVVPYCHEIINADFESEVEDDMLSIFRKGEEFNYGMELVLLITFGKSSLDGPAEDALVALSKLTMDFPSLIVQATIGANFNISSAEYTHAVVIRFRSSEAFQMFMNSSEYNNMWRSKFQPIVQKHLSVHFSIDPVGTELM